MKTVAQVKEELSGLLTGTNLNNVTAIDRALERAARITVQKLKAPEAIGRQAVTLYDGVYNYAPDTAIFGGSLRDFRPQGNSRTPNDYVYKEPIQVFDREKKWLPNGYAIAFEWNKGTPIMRVTSPNPYPRAILDPMTDDDGWTAAGSASGLLVDETVYYENPASLRFQLAGASTGTLTKAISQQDIDIYEDVGVAFLAIYAPTITNLTNIELRIGSSATAYNNVTATQGFLGAWKSGEWTIVAFDFSAASQTGTPDWNAIDYIQVRVTHAGAMTNFRVGGLWISLPAPHELIYGTAAVFMAASTPSVTISSDSDQILFSDASFTIYTYLSAKEIAMQMSGGKFTAQIKGFDDVLTGSQNEPGLIPLYRADNPSEDIGTKGNWYD
jgi:hypothetical protein